MKMKLKLIDVFVKQANKEIKKGTILRVPDEGLFGKKSAFEFEFYEGSFYGEEMLSVEELCPLDEDFLNKEVELISPKERYLIKVNVRGLIGSYGYLNYSKEKGGVVLSTEINNCDYKTHFTKEELQSIKPVREFLEDMEGKYQLIEAETRLIITLE